MSPLARRAAFRRASTAESEFAPQAARKEKDETKITLLEKQIAELKHGIAELGKKKEALKTENVDLRAIVEQLRREDRNAQVTIRFLEDQLQADRSKKVGRQLVRRRTKTGGREIKNARLTDFT